MIKSSSDLLPVREVAMMGIMDRLTDKKDWHKKVFDDIIVEKWREEAMAIPDEEFLKTAAAPARSWVPDPDLEEMDSLGPQPPPVRLEGIMSEAAFDYVGYQARCFCSLSYQLTATAVHTGATQQSQAFRGDRHGFDTRCIGLYYQVGWLGQR